MNGIQKQTLLGRFVNNVILVESRSSHNNFAEFQILTTIELNS